MFLFLSGQYKYVSLLPDVTVRTYINSLFPLAYLPLAQGLLGLAVLYLAAKPPPPGHSHLALGVPWWMEGHYASRQVNSSLFVCLTAIPGAEQNNLTSIATINPSSHHTE